MSQSTAFYFDERCLWHSTGLSAGVLPIGGWVQPPAAAGHAESPETKRRLKSLMDVSGLTEALTVRSAPPATDEQIRAVHDGAYLARLKAASDAGGGDAGSYTPFGPGSYEIAKLSAGLAIAAVDAVLSGTYRNAYSLSRPPGHHALADQGLGFCLLSNISIAVEAAIKHHRLSRIAIVDWDVHHGNGTQAIFYDRPDVLTISLHQEACFPPGESGMVSQQGEGAGAGYNINIPLPPGSGDAAYRYAMERIVVPVLDRYRPELLIIANGLDANGFDPLARMLLHSESFRAMTQMMLDVAARHCAGHLVAVHEGGYAESYVPFCGHAVIEALAGTRTAVEDPMLAFFQLQQPNARLAHFQCALIDEMAAAFGL